ncbi:DUF6942 family protein [Photobacterium galatheae]|uniref:Uncharacterized protein n=1 Tax=Photobacterium galatheae TaxID=1654360 RepID=A0A066RKT1_9GAMM|nr:hypothetical protein [Photobacterium galatheae]KDM89681.1 hypothetical protein EA58_20970 [Photobacterium galatheae]MCM0151566.1 hypothetical protein [Photobacterium galatheae]
MPENNDKITEEPVLVRHHQIGLGCPDFTFAAYIENRPDMPGMATLDQLQPAIPGEIHSIGQACGNGWRKVFNVYAKLMFALDNRQFSYTAHMPSWQHYRDHFLLQSSSQTALLFSPPNLIAVPDEACSPKYHIIMGRTYAKKLISTGQLTAPLIWLDHEFAINREHRLVVCPYFDYRQLSNIKIERLAAILAEFGN